MESSFTTLSSIGNFTSDGLSVPEEVPKHQRKLSRNMAKESSMLEQTDSEFVMVVVFPFQGQYLRQAGARSACKCDGHE